MKTKNTVCGRIGRGCSGAPFPASAPRPPGPPSPVASALRLTAGAGGGGGVHMCVCVSICLRSLIARVQKDGVVHRRHVIREPGALDV